MSPVAQLLGLLDLDALVDLADAFGLEPPSAADDTMLRTMIVGDENATIHAVLAALPREILKHACKSLSLPLDGRGRAAFVRRLVDVLGRSPDATTRTLQVEVTPRQPRLAWNGMDQREAVTSVPSQIVEVVRPARAIDRESGNAPELPNVNVSAAAVRMAETLPNRLLWTNDNLVALRTLLDEVDPKTHEPVYKGKVDLIYIDPPFMVGGDFRGDNTIDIAIDDDEEITAKKEPSLVEFIAYRDTWRNGLDSFLIMLRRRLELLKQLLAPTGSIYVHLDWHAVHYIKVLMDEIFGYENFVNEIVWKRRSGYMGTYNRLGSVTDSLLVYAANADQICFNEVFGAHDPEYIKRFKYVNDDGRKYRLDNLTSPNYRPNLRYEYKGFSPPPNGWAVSPETMREMDREGRIEIPKDRSLRIQRRSFLDEKGGQPLQSLWDDIPPVNPMALEGLGFPTQKPLALLERIIKMSSPPGGLVLDCFMGSGTTLEAAERLGRRWIGIDCGKYAVHLARKRMILLHGTKRPPDTNAFDFIECESCKNVERKPKKQKSPGPFEVRPFTVESMGVYQRAEQWQDFQLERNRYRDEMVRVYGGEPTDTHPLLHGKKERSWIHIGPLDSPVSVEQVYAIVHAVKDTAIHQVTVLCADYDAISSEKDKIKRDTGVTVDIRTIPQNAIDEVKRRIESQRNGGTSLIESMAVPIFYAPLSIYLTHKTDGRMVTVKLKRCEVDHESFLASQRPTLKPIENATTPAQKKRAQDEAKRWALRRKELKAWLDKATSWQHFVDFWAVDWRYGERTGNDGRPVFETAWQSFRTRDGKGDSGGLTFSAQFEYDKWATYRIAARVTDVFGNDGIATVQVVVK